MPLQFREAILEDIPQIQVVRHAVKENTLSNPALVTDADCAEYMTRRGKGWVCLNNGIVVGFAIADLQENNIWALFVDPDFAGQGIGRQLHDTMLDWYFSQTQTTVWLGTAPHTRAEKFYTRAGWRPLGMYNATETKFEMTYADWRHRCQL
jgi:GNAT superfamily N-acetyltransferase